MSSHALVQARVDGVHFDVAVFTNLSHDHLDYHGSMEAYYQAKRRLFTPDHSLRGIVNADDPWGQRLMKESRIPVTAVHLSDAQHIALLPGQTSFTWRGHRITTPLTGAVNVGNTLLAAEAALALGLEVAEVARALSLVSPVPGRLQVLAAPRRDGAVDAKRPPFTVMVDYAHTPAGLEVVLREARQLTGTPGRVLVVFGCGGNRDRGKRPKMGQTATSQSDVAILTSDNPRDEDPMAIMAEVQAGMVAGSGTASTVIVEADRHVAIRRALAEAAAGDVVVIAGKGHETYQEIAGQRIPFNDAEEARHALSVHFPSDPSSWLPAPSDGVPAEDH
jgi:UDP-N-acetylmuramoyl-L-alanyl-D-glutamate--2,6-diaminopimelate ligase